jgi:hypothetical protein
LSLSPQDLAGAAFAQFGSTLIVTTGDGTTFAVPGFFPGPDLGLPPGLDTNDVEQIGQDAFAALVEQADPATRQKITALSGEQAPGAVDKLLDEVAEANRDGETSPEEFETAAGGPQGGPDTPVVLPGNLDPGVRAGAANSGGEFGFSTDTRGAEISRDRGDDVLIGGGEDASDAAVPRSLNILSFNGPNGLLGLSSLEAVAPIAAEFAGGASLAEPLNDRVLEIPINPPQEYDFDQLRSALAVYREQNDPDPDDDEPGPSPAAVIFTIDSADLADVAPGQKYITFVGEPTPFPLSLYLALAGGYAETKLEGVPTYLAVDGDFKANDLDAAEGYVHKISGTALNHDFFSPGHRHGAAVNLVIHTNLTAFEITDESTLDNIRAFPSLAVGDGSPVEIDPLVSPDPVDPLIDNAPDLRFYYAGVEDKDWISFYDRDDPHGGNGNYSLSDPASYGKIHKIEVIDASSFRDAAPDGYGVNDVRLNVDAVRAMTQVDVKATDPTPEGGPQQVVFPYYKIIVLGDAEDTATLTDEQFWTYTGIVDKAEMIVEIILGEEVGIETVLATRDEYGTAFYEFQYTGPQLDLQTFVWISDDIGDHPDFYWTGTAGDDSAEFPDSQFGVVDAFDGFDTLFMNNAEAALTVDFTGTGGGIANFEAISLVDNGSVDDITLDRQFVLDASGANYLFVYGDSGDVLNLAPGDGWMLRGRLNDPDADADDTYIYQAGNTFVYADIDLAVSGAGPGLATADGNILFVTDTGFDPLDGKAGFDRLGFLQEGDIDLTGLADNSIANIEVFDLTNGVANDLIFGALTMDLFGASELYIVGDAAGDALTLTDAPSWTRGATFAAGDFNLVGFTAVENGHNLQLWVDENLI